MKRFVKFYDLYHSNYYRLLFVLPVIFLLSSCGKLGNFGGGSGTGNKGPNVPVAILLSGSQTINAGECQRYTITSINTEGNATPVTQNTLLTLTGTGGGNFFDSADCSARISELPLVMGRSTANIYFETHTAETLVFSVGGTPIFALPALLRVIVLPVTQLTISESPSYDFGPRYLNTSTDKVFTVTNSGESAVSLLQAGTPALATPFSFKGGTYPGTGGTCTNTLGPEGASCTLVVRFTPSTLGLKTSSLILSYSDSVSEFSISRTLTGTGVDSGSLNFQTTTSFELGDDRAFASVMQPDQKLLVAGYSNRATSGNDFSLIRYLSSGAVDSTFGSSGKAYASFGNGDDRAIAIALQTDGKIVLGGYANISGTYRFALARFSSSGVLDASFGTGGMTSTGIGLGDAFAFSVALQSDGKIILAGYSQLGGGNHISLVRFTTSGALDTSFGDSGISVNTIGSGSSYANGIGIDSVGNILVAGYANNLNIDFVVLRFLATGILDTSFGSGGVVLTDFNGSSDYAYAMGIQNDGRIVVAGTSVSGGDNHFAVLRLTSSGALDLSFNGTGKLNTSVATHFDEAHAISIQSDGKIVFAGFAHTGSRYDFALMRCDSAGNLDLSFGGSGTTTISFGASQSSRAYGLSVGSDGTLYAIGDTQASADFDFALASLLP